ncbi:MAG: translation elongation factor Ts [Acidiferrobacterales bacterium]|nr:translation elongation factor Ts [Acidiferrobacterales bacterium]
MAVSAAQVKELRERTGLGMMECKNALVESGGDMDEAIEWLRKRAGTRVDKKSGRIAAEGRISAHLSADRKLAALVEVNSETDFVAKEEGFARFADLVAACVVRHNPPDVVALLALPLEDGKRDAVRQVCDGLIARLGEKISVRRFVRYQTDAGKLDAYVHAGSRIGVLVEVQGGEEALAHDIALHVAAMRPEYLTPDEVPPEVVSKEKEILMEQARESGKPPEIIEKMVVGRLNKYLAEQTLLGQPFVRDADITVGKLLQKSDTRVARFCRFEVGEGLEKKSSDFAAEVMAQAKGG